MAEESVVVGVTGLKRTGGYIQEEYLRELQGARWHRTVSEMTNDPIVGGVLFAIEMLIRQVTWTVVAGTDDEAGRAAATFVDECRQDMETNWPDTLAEILSFLPWGWAALETVYKMRGGASNDPTRHSKYSDGRIGWRSWSIRSQDTLEEWSFDEAGTAIGFYQVAPPLYRRTYIPLSKCLHFRATSRKGSPEGWSLLRRAYRPWYFKTRIENIEGLGTERDLAGIPVARIPSGVIAARGTEYAEWQNTVVNIRQDEMAGLVVPSDRDTNGYLLYEVELLTSGGTRQFDTDKIINRNDARMAMTVLADFLLLGHQRVGSFALASDKTDLFAVALGAWLDSIAAVINEQAIPRLLRLNGMSTANPPRLTHGDIEKVDLSELSNYIKNITGSGVVLTPEQQDHLLEQGGLPVTKGATRRPQPKADKDTDPKEDTPAPPDADEALAEALEEAA